MVRALLNGSKTQTRRIVKPQPPADRRIGMVNAAYCGRPNIWLCDGDVQSCRDAIGVTEWACPYGQPGDRLWVREQFGRFEKVNEMPAGYGYAADLDTCGQVLVEGVARTWDKVKHWPSIHMPRWASRITLEITGIRAERLNDISDRDAKAEGVERNVHLDGSWSSDDGWIHYINRAKNNDEGFPAETARESYCTLWESINGPGSWAVNPWVWVVEFKRVDQ